jgi:hypothetical protein
MLSSSRRKIIYTDRRHRAHRRCCVLVASNATTAGKKPARLAVPRECDDVQSSGYGLSAEGISEVVGWPRSGKSGTLLQGEAGDRKPGRY